MNSQVLGMKIRLESENGKSTHLALSGTVAETTSKDDPLKALQVRDIYARGILLNMNDVQMLNSHGVGWLLRTHKLCRETGGKLVLYSVPQLVRNVLRMMRLTELLHIAEDGAQAEAMLEGDAAHE